jgi:hypothetical protein
VTAKHGSGLHPDYRLAGISSYPVAGRYQIAHAFGAAQGSRLSRSGARSGVLRVAGNQYLPCSEHFQRPS